MSRIATFMPRFGLACRVAVAFSCVVLVVVIPHPARAETRPSLIVLPASGRGVSEAIIRRARALLVDSLGRPGRFLVLDYDRPPTSVGPGSEAAIRLAQGMGARVAVWMDLSRDAGRTAFEIWCWDALTTRPACHLRETTTAGPRTLPDFTEWLTLQLLRTLDGSPDDTAGRASSPATSASATGGLVAHAPEPTARSRRFTFGVRIGLTMPVDSPTRALSPLGRFGVIIAADLGRLLTDVGVDYHSGTGARRLRGIGLDLLMPLSTGERLAYLGGGAWRVDQTLGGRGARGIQLRPTVGILWGRHDVARLRVDAAYFVDLFEERELDRLFPGSGRAHLAHGLMISTGATY